MTPRILLIRINFDALIHKNASFIPCTSLKEHLPRPFFLLDFRWLMSLGLKWRLPTWGQVEPPGALALKEIEKQKRKHVYYHDFNVFSQSTNICI